MIKSIDRKIYILEDVFPHPYSINSWRGLELIAHLNAFSSAHIITTLSSINLLGADITKDDILSQFNAKYPDLGSRVEYKECISASDIEEGSLIYTIFLNNIYNYLNIIEQKRCPFIFELYPGGGFAINNEVSDKKLHQVISSPFFKGIIVSNNVTYQYLKQKKWCPDTQILYVPGCVVDTNIAPKNMPPKRYPQDKSHFDIAFVAYRYSEHGEDKGYDIFVNVAKELHKLSNSFTFHVVGSFDENTIDVAELHDKIHFYGVHDINWFNEFYPQIDIILSPNRPFYLGKGFFDGFPTGCAVDAILRKVVLIASDELHQNVNMFKNGEDVFIVKNDINIIIDRILFLQKFPDELSRLAINGCNRAHTIYSEYHQLKPRIDLLQKVLQKINVEV